MIGYRIDKTGAFNQAPKSTFCLLKNKLSKFFRRIF